MSIASTGKNAVTGNLETQTYRVEGPVMLFSTTTAIDLDEELLNRCLVLSVDESREQTQAIHAAQRSRRTLAGLRAGVARDEMVALHQNAQRLLRPLAVVNPYAERLTFLSEKTRMRRDHEKYLALIDAIALLHQYQREVKRETCGSAVVEYIEVELSDIAQANALAHAVLGRTLDELPPQTRKLLGMIAEHVRASCADTRMKRSDYRFSRKTVRAVSGWSDGQLKIHCARLEDMEYLLVHRGSRGKSIEYELLFDGQLDEDVLHLMGLIDVEGLQKCGYDDEKSGVRGRKSGASGERSAPSQGQVSHKSGSSQGAEIVENDLKSSVIDGSCDEALKNAPLEEKVAVHRSRNRTHSAGSSLAAASASEH